MSDASRKIQGPALARHDCAESRLLMTRRHMLGLTAGLFSAAALPRWAEAAGSASSRLLVVLLRGGLDGLSTVVPHGDPDYVRLRGGLALPPTSTIPLDGFFGLNPAMPNFGAWYGAGQAAVVHATCVPVRNRSHFDCQDNLETGLGGIAPNATGWLNRLFSALPAGDPVRIAGAIQIADAPLILRGPAPVLGWSPTWYKKLSSSMSARLLENYDALDQPMRTALDLGLRSQALATGTGAPPAASLGELRRGCIGAARLMAAAGGPHLAVLNVHGFDTHSAQGTLDGELYSLLGELDTALGDFRTEVGSLWANTVVLCVTEFGRTAARNGDAGTDHGVGTVALLAGGAVAGRRVYGNWPGLSPAALHEGSDLRATTDLRAVFRGVLEAHLGVPRSLLNTTVFPESRRLPSMTSLIKTVAADRSIAKGAEAIPIRAINTRLADYRRRRGT